MIQIMTITPDMARHWLEGNTINRTVRAAMVEKYARDMAASGHPSPSKATRRMPSGTLPQTTWSSSSNPTLFTV